MARFEDEIYKITEKELILNYKRYEYTNNMVYEFFERTLKNKKDIKDFQYISPMEHTLKIKDVILFENDGTKFTLQDVIYNACPKLYEELVEDDNKQDKVNYSMYITKFLSLVKIAEDTIKEMQKKINDGKKLTPDEEKDYNESKNFFNTVIYKDLNQNKYIQLTKDKILKKIEETILYKKINVRYTKDQLNLEECNFINIYDLNINLPDEELLDYLLMVKAKHKATTKSITKEFNDLSNEEKSKIKRYITFKSKKLLTKKNQKRKLESVREPVSLFNQFLEVDKIKKINESKIEEETLEKIYQEYKDLEQENFERIQKENKKKNLEYKSYIYDPQKLAHILFVYDHMQTKIENDTYKLMKRIQCSILYHRREFINILETEDLEDECGLSENDSNKVINLKNELYDLLKFNPSLEEEFDKDTLILIDEENIKEIDKLMKKIYTLMNENCRKRFLPYLPFISSRTLYKYYEIAKFYIDEKGYKLLLD